MSSNTVGGSSIQQTLEILGEINEPGLIQENKEDFETTSQRIQVMGTEYCILPGSPSDKIIDLPHFWDYLSFDVSMIEKDHRLPPHFFIKAINGIMKLNGCTSYVPHQVPFSNLIKLLEENAMDQISFSDHHKLLSYMDDSIEFKDPDTRCCMINAWIGNQIQKLPKNPLGWMWTAKKAETTVYLLGTIHVLPIQSYPTLPLPAQQLWSTFSSIAFERSATASIAVKSETSSSTSDFTAPKLIEYGYFTERFGTEEVIRHLKETKPKSPEGEILSLEEISDDWLNTKRTDLGNHRNVLEDNLIGMWRFAEYYYRGDFAGIQECYLNGKVPSAEMLKRNRIQAKTIDDLNLDKLLACVGTGHFCGKGSVLDCLNDLGWSVSFYQPEML